MNRTRSRRHGHSTGPAAPAVDVTGPRIAGDARLVAGGTLTGRARAGGHAVVIGSAVVAEQAVVTDNAVVAGQATVCGAATVSGHAAVLDDAWAGGQAWLFDHAVIRGQASVGDQAQVFGTATVAGQTTVTDQAWVFADASVDGQAHVGGRARIGGGRVTGTARIDGDIRVRPGALIGDDADLQTPDHLHMVELARRVHATLYRCSDGGVGAGLPDGWHGRLDPDQLPEELGRHHHLIHELAARWTHNVDEIEPACAAEDSAEAPEPDPPDRPGDDVPITADSQVDTDASWARWAPSPIGG